MKVRQAGCPWATDPRTCETFDAASETYQRARPEYPDELITRVIGVTQVGRDDDLLEIGCATGKATLAFARRGFRITCIEPGPNPGGRWSSVPGRLPRREIGADHLAGRSLPEPGQQADRRDEIEASGLFDVVEIRHYVWEKLYDADAYIDLLDTFSNHIVMEQ